MNRQIPRIGMASLASLIVLAVVACMPACERTPRHPRLYIGINNLSADTFEDAYVEGVGFKTIVSWIGPQSGFSDGPIPVADLPDVYTVYWTIQEQPDRQYKVAVDLTDQLPDDFQGTIYFRIHPDHSVSVQLDRFGDESPPSEPFGRFIENTGGSIDSAESKRNSKSDK